MRDVVFVLGAGASYGDGVPLQREILPVLLDGRLPHLQDSVMGRQVREFIDANFYVDAEKGEFPKLEAVFGFLDYFITQRESLNAQIHLRGNRADQGKPDQNHPLYRR
jgi:hypothetical protein